MISIEADLPDELLHGLSNGQSILYICSHPLLMQQRKRQLMTATGGYIGVRWELLPRVADRIVQRAGLAYMRIDQAAREDLLESLLEQLDREQPFLHLRQVLGSPGLARSIALWIEDLEKGHAAWVEPWMVADGGVRASAPASALGELWRIYKAYATRTQEVDFPYKETAGLYKLAADLLHARSCADMEPEHYDLVLVEGWFAHSPDEKRFIEALWTMAGRVVVPAVALRPVASRLQWMPAQSRLEEIRQVVAAVAANAAAGRSDSLIVAADAAYLRGLRRECAAQGLAVRGAASCPLLHAEEARRLLVVLRLAQSNWQRRLLIECAHGYSAAFGLAGEAFAWGRELIEGSGVQGEAEAWRRLLLAARARAALRLQHLGEAALPALAEEARRRLRYARQWLRLVNKLRQWTGLLRQAASWSELLPITLRISQEDAKLCRSQTRSAVDEALRHLLRIRLAMVRLAGPPAAGRLLLQRYVRWLRTRLGQATFKSVEAKRVDDAGVMICLPDECYGLRHAHVYIAGLSEKSFPRSYDPHWIWQLLERELPAAFAGRDQRAEQEQADEMYLNWAIRAAQHRLALSADLGAAGEGTGRVSRFVKQRFGVPFGEPTGPILLSESSFENVPSASPTCMGADVRQPAERRAVPFFQQQRSLSVTGLDLYGKCAFRYFAERVLQVSEPVSREAGLRPLDAGHMVHRVLRALFSEGLQLDEQAWLRLADERLQEALSAHAHRFQLSGSRWEAQARQLQREVLSFAASEYEQRPQRALLEWGFGQVHAEKMDAESLAQPLQLVRGSLRIQLTGMIDRIDLQEQSYQTVDYKLSSSPTPAEIEQGEDLQQMLYVWAYQELGQRGLRAEGARYAVVRNAADSVSIAFSDSTAWDKIKETVLDRVFALVQKLEAGDVSPQPRRLSMCSFCSLRGVCRKRV